MKKNKLVNVDIEKWELFGIIAKVKSVEMQDEVDSFLNKYIIKNKELIPKKYLDVLNKIMGENKKNE